MALKELGDSLELEGDQKIFMVNMANYKNNQITPVAGTPDKRSLLLNSQALESTLASKIGFPKIKLQRTSQGTYKMVNYISKPTNVNQRASTDSPNDDLVKEFHSQDKVSTKSLDSSKYKLTDHYRSEAVLFVTDKKQSLINQHCDENLAEGSCTAAMEKNVLPGDTINSKGRKQELLLEMEKVIKDPSKTNNRNQIATTSQNDELAGICDSKGETLTNSTDFSKRPSQQRKDDSYLVKNYKTSSINLHNKEYQMEIESGRLENSLPGNDIHLKADCKKQEKPCTVVKMINEMPQSQQKNQVVLATGTIDQLSQLRDLQDKTSSSPANSLEYPVKSKNRIETPNFVSSCKTSNYKTSSINVHHKEYQLEIQCVPTLENSMTSKSFILKIKEKEKPYRTIKVTKKIAQLPLVSEVVPAVGLTGEPSRTANEQDLADSGKDNFLWNLCLMRTSLLQEIQKEDESKPYRRTYNTRKRKNDKDVYKCDLKRKKSRKR